MDTTRSNQQEIRQILMRIEQTRLRPSLLDKTSTGPEYPGTDHHGSSSSTLAVHHRQTATSGTSCTSSSRQPSLHHSSSHRSFYTDAMFGLRVLHVFADPMSGASAWIMEIPMGDSRDVLGGWRSILAGQQPHQNERNGVSDSDRSQTAERVYH